MDWIIDKALMPLRNYLVDTRSWGLLILFAVVCGLVSTFSCDVISPVAAGSGIPEMKTILSGVMLNNYLSARTLVAKILGLVSGMAGDLYIGKEGPFVHISASVAHLLCKIPLFAKHARSPTAKRSILAVAVATGVAATFGAPVGGVLFSIEVTSTFFMVNSLWKTFFSSIVCVLTFYTIHAFGAIELFHASELPEFHLSLEILAFASLGVLCGVIGGVFVYFTSKVSQLSRRILHARATKYLYTCVIMTICCFMGGWMPYLKNEDRDKLSELFSIKSLDPDRWGSSVIISLSIFFVSKLFGTVISLSCPIPCGVFTPIFVTGAAFGRFYGTIMSNMFSAVPAAYAVVGAAALTAGVTRTISVTVIVFELTGQLNHMVPVMLAVLMAYSTNSALSISVYDLMLHIKELPYLPSVKSAQEYSLTAGKIAHSVPFSACIPSDGGSLLDAYLARLLFQASYVPVRRECKLSGVIPSKYIDLVLYRAVLANPYLLRSVQTSYSAPHTGTASHTHSLTHTGAHADLDYTHAYIYTTANEASPPEPMGTHTSTPPYNNPHTDTASQSSLNEQISYHDSGIGHRRSSKSEEIAPLFSLNETTDKPHSYIEDLAKQASGVELSPMRRKPQNKQLLKIVREELSKYDTNSLNEIPFSAADVLADTSPLYVSPATPMTKIHFLFTMLSLGQLLVYDQMTDRIGVITKESFLMSTADENEECDTTDMETLKEQLLQQRNSHL